MQLSNANPITHKYLLGPTYFTSSNGVLLPMPFECVMCGVQCSTEVWSIEGTKYTQLFEELCWFCFAQKYGQTGNAVKGLYNGVPILRQFGG